MAVIGNSSTQQSFTPAIDYFSGNGSTTAFTLSRPVASVAQVQVTINNVAQNPSTAYTVSGSTITFTSAPLSGTNNIYVYYTSPITQVIAPGQGTVGLTQLSASGTASSSTYLRGDNSWGAIATNAISNGTSNVTIASSNGAITAATAGTTAITVDASQNVGIGVTPSSTNKLQVSSAGTTRLYVENTTNSVGVRLQAYSTYGLLQTDTNHPLSFATNNGAIQMSIATSGILQFNSGYGSAANAYGCRAWVNFNGVSGVSIRGSANVSSVTRSAAGLYIVYYSTAMPDANYAALATCQPNGFGGTFAGTGTTAAGSQTASQGTIEVRNVTNTDFDSDWISFAVFR